MVDLTPKYATFVPSLCYDTAWHRERTRDLVYQAIKTEFRGIDTAAHREHYPEDLVGAGIRDAINEGIVRREDLYVSVSPPAQRLTT